MDGYLDSTLEEMIEELEQAELFKRGYDGPGAQTVQDIMEATDMGRDTVVRWGRKMVAAGKWVQVDILNPDRGLSGQPSTLIGWVKVEIYNEWLGDNDE